MEEKKIDFEKSLKRLEEISNTIENEVLPLDESLKLYEEGKKIIKELEDYIKAAEDKICSVEVIEK